MTAAAAMAVALLGGCEAPWSAPAGPITLGAVRVTEDGELDFWLGAECSGVGEIRVELTADGDSARQLDSWTVRVDGDGGAPVEYLRIGTAPDGFDGVDALRTDWEEAHLVRIRVTPAGSPEGSAESTGAVESGGAAEGERPFYPDVPIRASIPVEPVLDETERWGSDQWYVPDQGWFSADEYRALANDDDMIYPYCAVPDR